MDKTAPYLEVMEKAFKNFFDMFITPEIVRRQEQGELPKPIHLQRAQIIFFPDKRPPKVRINSEVWAKVRLRFKSGVPEKKPGDPLLAGEIDELQDIRLDEREYRNCGHATFIKIGQTWSWAFDFRYNMEHAREHFAAAEQFYESAQFSLEKGNWIAFVDSLFSCTELLAKATVITFADADFVKKTSHGEVQRRFNRFARMGNVPEDQRSLFNRVSGWRGDARYLRRRIDLTAEDAQSMLDTVSNMMQDVSHMTELPWAKDS